MLPASAFKDIVWVYAAIDVVFWCLALGLSWWFLIPCLAMFAPLAIGCFIPVDKWPWTHIDPWR